MRGEHRAHPAADPAWALRTSTGGETAGGFAAADLSQWATRNAGSSPEVFSSIVAEVQFWLGFVSFGYAALIALAHVVIGVCCTMARERNWNHYNKPRRCSCTWAVLVEKTHPAATSRIPARGLQFDPAGISHRTPSCIAVCGLHRPSFRP